MLLIDKDDLIEHVQKRHREYYFYYNMSEYYEGLCDAYYAVLNFILKQKAIEKRKYGHWVGKPIAGFSTVSCSVCKSKFTNNTGRWNYCPHCGAVMD